MTRHTLLFAICLLGATGAHLFNHQVVLPESLKAKNYPGLCSAADQAATKTCLDAYFNVFGIDTSKGVPPFLEFQALTSSVISMYGSAGFDVYCDFESTLETCLGDLMTSACMNTDAFTKMYGMNQEEATNYATSYAVESYTCQHKDLAKTYYPCITSNEKEIMPALIECAKTMRDEFHNSSDTCVPIDHYVSCLEDHYVEICDAGIRTYICNTSEIAINFDTNGLCAEAMHQC